jgi:hypothetical protein
VSYSCFEAPGLEFGRASSSAQYFTLDDLSVNVTLREGAFFLAPKRHLVNVWAKPMLSWLRSNTW